MLIMSVDGGRTENPSRGGRSRSEGVVLPHVRSCPNRDGGRCSCSPTFQAQVWSPHLGGGDGTGMLGWLDVAEEGLRLGSDELRESQTKGRCSVPAGMNIVVSEDSA